MSSSAEGNAAGQKIHVDKKTSDLNRIRDNQRRSRARHREYVQELEQKYRACQQAGSEASMEVQAAARAVLEENLRLRALLNQQGVLQQMPGDGSPPALLQNLLATKRPCCDGSKQKERATVIASPPLESAVPQPIASKPPTRDPGPAANFSPSSPYGMPWILPSSPEADLAGNAAGHGRQTCPVPPHQASPLNMTCSDAASLIRGSFPNTGPDLEQDMNCASNPSGCVVPNTRVFELLDKYGWG